MPVHRHRMQWCTHILVLRWSAHTCVCICVYVCAHTCVCVGHRSIMTYDYAAGPGPQPNSPLPWLQQQTKILINEAGACVYTRSGVLVAHNAYTATLSPQCPCVLGVRVRLQMAGHCARGLIRR
jgi:hypothetical protein